MCSVSLIRDQNGLLLTMNRDERRERHEAGLFVDESHSYPIDGDAGGTWCGVNKYGLVAALLNRYQDVHQSSGTTSRGSLIPMLLAHASVSDAVQRFDSLELDSFNPFTLIVADEFHTLTWCWNGAESTHNIGDPEHFLFYSSSSVDPARITQERLATFGNSMTDKFQKQEVAQDVLAIHLHRTPETHSSALFMDRELSHTKSVVQAHISGTEVKFDYYDEAALTPVREGLHSLPLVSGSASFVLDRTSA